jgi:hypothetical protein
MTPEAMIASMSGAAEPMGFDNWDERRKEQWRRARNFAGQRSVIRDESSGLLAGAGKDYNAGYLEFLLQAYDCRDYSRETISRGTEMVNNIYLSFLGASTPAAMGRYLQDEKLRNNGWWARFAIITPDSEPEWKKPTNIPPSMPDGLLSGLHRLLGRLPSAEYPDNPKPIDVLFGAGTFDLWERYDKAQFDMLKGMTDESHNGVYGRLPTQALKVGMLLAAMDWSKEAASPVIELPHMTRAIETAETWRASYHRALQLTTTSEHDRVSNRVIRIVAKEGNKGVSLRTLKRSLKDLEPQRIQEVLEQMVTMSELEAVEKGNPNGGRKSLRYVIR